MLLGRCFRYFTLWKIRTWHFIPLILDWFQEQNYIFFSFLKLYQPSSQGHDQRKGRKKMTGFIGKTKQAGINVKFWSQNIFPAISCIITKWLWATRQAQGTTLRTGEPLPSLLWRLLKSCFLGNARSIILIELWKLPLISTWGRGRIMLWLSVARRKWNIIYYIPGKYTSLKGKDLSCQI